MPGVATASRIPVDIRRLPWIKPLVVDYAFDHARVAPFFAGVDRGGLLRVSSNVPDHVHLHGYDIMRDVGPGQPAQIAFRATIPGTVEAELEDSGVQIATITAKP